MLALAVYEAGLCDCGFHESLTQDKSNFFMPETRKCPVCAATQQHARVLLAQDEKATEAMGDKPPPATPRPADGRRLFVRRLTREEAEQVKERRHPNRATGSGLGPDSAPRPPRR